MAANDNERSGVTFSLPRGLSMTLVGALIGTGSLAGFGAYAGAKQSDVTALVRAEVDQQRKEADAKFAALVDKLDSRLARIEDKQGTANAQLVELGLRLRLVEQRSMFAAGSLSVPAVGAAPAPAPAQPTQ